MEKSKEYLVRVIKDVIKEGTMVPLEDCLAFKLSLSLLMHYSSTISTTNTPYAPSTLRRARSRLLLL